MKQNTTNTITTIIVTALMLTLTGKLLAQTPSNQEKEVKVQYVYLSGGGGVIINGSVAGASINLIQSNNWGYTAKFNWAGIEARALPQDYQPGICIFGGCVPTDDLVTVSMKLMREFPTRSKSLRFGVEAGPAFGIFREAYFIRNPNMGWFGSSYYTRYSESGSIGLEMRAKLALPLTTVAGLEAAIVSAINAQQPYLGIEFMLTTGKVRERIRPKNQN